jgi:hypothetical protein
MTDCRIVPVEPTEEMVDDFAREYQDAGPQSTVEMTKRVKRARVRIALRAMLSAAPAVDREKAIEAAARAYHDTVFAPRASQFNGAPCPPFDEIGALITNSHRAKVTPIADAILALFGEGE